MTTATWLMMLLMLGLNWGGFALLIWYGVSRDPERRGRARDDSRAASERGR